MKFDRIDCGMNGMMTLNYISTLAENTFNTAYNYNNQISNYLSLQQYIRIPIHKII